GRAASHPWQTAGARRGPPRFAPHLLTARSVLQHPDATARRPAPPLADGHGRTSAAGEGPRAALRRRIPVVAGRRTRRRLLASDRRRFWRMRLQDPAAVCGRTRADYD